MDRRATLVHSGAVGMMGISWGGFNSLQIAALSPPALKAVIAIGTTVDRYNDDIHYKNGCLLYSNFWWSSVMLCYASRPPDPLLVGEKWRDMWLHRLNTQPFPLAIWLAHQRRDDFWRHGSICENYAAITAPALVISGWADGYLNAPPAAVENLSACAKAINGPWIHKYPHFAYPHPRMDFHAEALRWWDHCLKGIDNNIESLPDYRAYISENVRPLKRRDQEPGRWVAEQQWPPANKSTQTHYLAEYGQMATSPPAPKLLSICSPLDCGTASGEIFTLKPDADMQSDQRIDDAGSLCFDTEILGEAIEILGRPIIRLRVAIDKPLGNLAVRLIDVHPDGVGFRVSWGAINLAHRNGNEHPVPMTPGEYADIELVLDECGYRFLTGHKLRIAISTSYWPMLMPPPEAATATIELGGNTAITLPVREGGDEHSVPEPENQHTLPDYPMHKAAHCERRVDRDLQNHSTRYLIVDDTGEDEMPGHGLRTRHRHESQWSIALDDPLSAQSHSVYTCWMSRTDWSIRTESESEWACDTTHFHIKARVSAFENDRLINQREWKQSILRDGM